MQHPIAEQQDYGTGQKKLGLYITGLIICSILTLISFWATMSLHFSKLNTFIIIYTSACIQFVVQLIFFLRLNLQTEQGRTNVMSLVFTLSILTCVILGSLWIMWNLNYYMVH